MRNKLTSSLFLVVAIIALALVIKYLIIGNTVTPSKDNRLEPQISRSIGDSNDSEPTAKPLVDKDFTITYQKYFEGKKWVVLQIESTERNGADPALLVMKLDRGSYVTVLGPGTSFGISGVKQVPKSVYDYLTEQKRVYNDE